MFHTQTIAAGRVFEQFGPDHVGALAAVGLVAAGLILVARRASRGGRAWIAGGLAAMLISEVLFEPVYEMAVGVWRREESLPLHLCDLALYASIVALVFAARDPAPPFVRGESNSGSRVARGGPQLAYELSWYWGLAGTSQALLTPSVFETFPDVLYLDYFIAHGGIIVATLVLTIGCRWRPRPGSPWRVLLITYAIAPVVGLIDWLIGANYMYLCGPPPSASLYDYFGPWPWSVVTMAGVGVVLMWLCYAPFAIENAERGRSQRSA